VNVSFHFITLTGRESLELDRHLPRKRALVKGRGQYLRIVGKPHARDGPAIVPKLEPHQSPASISSAVLKSGKSAFRQSELRRLRGGGKIESHVFSGLIEHAPQAHDELLKNASRRRSLLVRYCRVFCFLTKFF
jgi:hypothetical protein